jgi:hypothetical protein
LLLDLDDLEAFSFLSFLPWREEGMEVACTHVHGKARNTKRKGNREDEGDRKRHREMY